MAIHRDFKGIWIPKQIWFFKGLSITEKHFLSEIDSLNNGSGCWAKNKHFAEIFGLSLNRCSEIINSLKKKDFIRIETEERETGSLRVIYLKGGFGISKGGSESRQEGSESRQEGSESRTPIYKDDIIHRDIQESDARALDFYKNQAPSDFETCMMQNKSMIKDFDKFCLDFNDKYDEEGKAYSVKIIRSRLNRFARNWAEVERKEALKTDETIKQEPNYLKNAI